MADERDMGAEFCCSDRGRKAGGSPGNSLRRILVLEPRGITRVGRRGDQLGNVGSRIIKGDGRDRASVGGGFRDLDNGDAFHTR